MEPVLAGRAEHYPRSLVVHTSAPAAISAAAAARSCSSLSSNSDISAAALHRRSLACADRSDSECAVRASRTCRRRRRRAWRCCPHDHLGPPAGMPSRCRTILYSRGRDGCTRRTVAPGVAAHVGAGRDEHLDHACLTVVCRHLERRVPAAQVAGYHIRRRHSSDCVAAHCGLRVP